jgi:hypothetical protein
VIQVREEEHLAPDAARPQRSNTSRGHASNEPCGTGLAAGRRGEVPRSPKTAYFFLGKAPNGRFHGYPHQAIVVAEGLKQLGWQIASDVATWRPAPGKAYLFPGDPDGPAPRECDLLIVSEDFFLVQGSPALPRAMLRSSVPAIFLDRSDLGVRSREMYSKPFRHFQAIFRTHGNERFRYPGNLRPMAFGISDRMVQATAAARAAGGSRLGLVWNFREKTFPHSVRSWAEREARPVLEGRIPLQTEVDPEIVTEGENDHYCRLMLQQTEGRHFPAYYERLARAEMAACFGGWFLLPLRQREAGPICLLGRRLMRSVSRPSSMIAQWDSWRMWEALAAGTAMLHVDMSRHGFLFGGPRPKPMTHYIALRLDDPARELLPLLDDPKRVREIGEAGRAWALEHYTSGPIAARILQQIGM